MADTVEAVLMYDSTSSADVVGFLGEQSGIQPMNAHVWHIIRFICRGGEVAGGVVYVCVIACVYACEFAYMYVCVCVQCT